MQAHKPQGDLQYDLMQISWTEILFSDMDHIENQCAG